MIDELDRCMWRVEDLEEENAKLRKLVEYIHALATDHGVYVQYPYCDAWDEKLAVAEKQMRELGIEVPSMSDVTDEQTSRDATIESWLASMSKSELIDQCFFWHDMALEQGRMYNTVKAENSKLYAMLGESWESR